MGAKEPLYINLGGVVSFDLLSSETGCRCAVSLLITDRPSRWPSQEDRVCQPRTVRERQPLRTQHDIETAHCHHPSTSVLLPSLPCPPHASSAPSDPSFIKSLWQHVWGFQACLLPHLIGVFHLSGGLVARKTLSEQAIVGIPIYSQGSVVSLIAIGTLVISLPDFRFIAQLTGLWKITIGWAYWKQKLGVGVGPCCNKR